MFEATGVYHRGLQKFLIESSIPYVMINPLVSAKIRKQSLRSIKTDKKDCRTIAKAYFNADAKDTVVEEVIDSHYHQMRQLNRYYQDTLVHLVKAKVSYNAKLDVVFPGYKNLFMSLYSDAATALVMKYKHPDVIKSKKKQSNINDLVKTSGYSKSFSEKHVDKIISTLKIAAQDALKQISIATY